MTRPASLVLKTKLSKTAFFKNSPNPCYSRRFPLTCMGYKVLLPVTVHAEKKNTVASNKVGQRSETFSSCQCHCRFGSQEAGCTEDPLLEPIADLSFQAGKVPLLKITTSFSDSTNVKCIPVCPPVDCAYYHSAADFFTQHKKSKVF